MDNSLMRDTGWKSPSTVVNDDSLEYGFMYWNNEENAKASNNNYAVADGDYDRTVYLKASNFGFEIPSRSLIEGIEVSIERKASDDYAVAGLEEIVKIVKSDGAIGSTDKGVSEYWTTSDKTVFYGGSTDLWGESWEVSDINNSNFGVVLSVLIENSAFAQVDHIQIKVYYTDSEPEDMKFTGAYGGFYAGQNYFAGSPRTAKDFVKLLVDSIDLSEDGILGIGKKFLESVVLVDGISKILEAVRSFVENINITDNISKVYDGIRGFIESINTVDSIGKIKGYVRNFVDSINVQDSISKVVGYVKSFVESVGVLDSVKTAKVLVVKFVESIVLIDKSIRKTIKNFIESIDITDTLARLLEAVRSFVESIEVSDVYTRVISKVMGDVINVRDGLKKALIYIRTFVESIVVTDVFGKIGTFIRNLVDSIIASDAVARLISLKAFVDNVDMSDIISKLTAKVVSSSIVIRDTFSKLGSFVRNFVDSLDIHDKADMFVGKLIYLVDRIVARDGLRKILSRYITDTIGLIDRLVRGFFIEFAEVLHVNDLELRFSQVFHLILQEVIGVSDSIKKHAIILLQSVLKVGEGKFVRRINGQLITWAKSIRKALEWAKVVRKEDQYIKVIKVGDEWNKEEKNFGSYQKLEKDSDNWTKLKKE